jgi:riboflavin kinase/FMN adenylyltransferase
MRYEGTVIHGDGEGRRLGYPTANIAAAEVEAGVFIGEVECEGSRYRAGVFVSRRRPVVEAHLLDFEGDLYGKILVVTCLRKIRDEFHYESEKELKEAIGRDIQTVREYGE